MSYFSLNGKKNTIIPGLVLSAIPPISMPKNRYKITEGMSSEEGLAQIADVRKCIKKGNEPDIDKAAKCLLDDLRSGKLGRITLDYPEG